MSFNPRQALERIRQNKSRRVNSNNDESVDISDSQAKIQQHTPISEEHQQSNVPRAEQRKDWNQEHSYKQRQVSSFDEAAIPNDIHSQVLPGTAVHSNILDNSAVIMELSRKIENLERVTRDLKYELVNSNESIAKLKREKSHLETHILKLEYENNKIKTSQRNTSRQQPTNKAPAPAKGASRDQNNNGSLASNLNIRLSSAGFDNNKTTTARSQIPTEILQPILCEPVDNVLLKKERNFRALKNSTKLAEISRHVNRHLVQLAQLEKEYPDMEKPVIVINISEADFE